MDLHFKSAAEIARLIRERKIGAVETLEHFLARVERYNPRLKAIVWLDAARARERARAADAALAKGEIWGPLHGVPMTIKESYNVAGSPTTWGDPNLTNNITDTSALAVERLEKAGVVLFGKTNVPLLLADHQSYNAIYGTTNNPWDLSRTPGGSSGGSAAALAAGLTGIEAGSDIGGSIRNPAHFCGCSASSRRGVWLPPRDRHCPARTPTRTCLSLGRWGAAPTISKSRLMSWRAPTKSTALPGSPICRSAARPRSRIFASP